jgi:hypothetical protein
MYEPGAFVWSPIPQLTRLSCISVPIRYVGEVLAVIGKKTEVFVGKVFGVLSALLALISNTDKGILSTPLLPE